MRKNIIISEGLPVERIIGLKFLYIVIDSEYKLHYEFNNRGHIVLPIHKSEILPWTIYKNFPKNLIGRCKSDKKNIIGVLQLWIYYTKDYSYGIIRGLGILQDFKGNKFKALVRLLKAMDEFCLHHRIKFVEASTGVIPEKVIRRAGFNPEPNRRFLHRFAEAVFRLTHYVKEYT